MERLANNHEGTYMPIIVRMARLSHFKIFVTPPNITIIVLFTKSR